MLISLGEWALAHNIDPATARQRAGRGAFETAKKIGRNWVIEEDEELIDHRKKEDSNMKEYYVLADENDKEMEQRFGNLREAGREARAMNDEFEANGLDRSALVVAVEDGEVVNEYHEDDF